MAPQTLTLEQFHVFRHIVEQYCGIALDEGRLGTLQRALQQRLSERGIDDFSYYHLILANPLKGEDELEKLAEILCVYETRFFRDASHFRILREHVLPAIMVRNEAKKHIRVWSAGCSTGEEAYSIAVCLLDALGPGGDWQLEVVGSDISRKALAMARKGVYSRKQLQGVPGDVVERYFDAVKEDLAVRSDVRELVRFERRNLARDIFAVESLGEFDAVFCENVTIYFSPETTKRVVEGCGRVLADGGYLFLGSSESLWRLSDGFSPVTFGDSYVYRKK